MIKSTDLHGYFAAFFLLFYTGLLCDNHATQPGCYRHSTFPVPSETNSIFIAPSSKLGKEFIEFAKREIELLSKHRLPLSNNASFLDPKSPVVHLFIPKDIWFGYYEGEVKILGKANNIGGALIRHEFNSMFGPATSFDINYYTDDISLSNNTELLANTFNGYNAVYIHSLHDAFDPEYQQARKLADKSFDIYLNRKYTDVDLKYLKKSLGRNNIYRLSSNQHEQLKTISLSFFKIRPDIIYWGDESSVAAQYLF